MTHDQFSESLIRDATSGIESAQATLVEGSRARLTEYVRARLGSHLKSRVEVEDVLQETFARALKSLPTFEWRGEDSFLRWLKGIASNEILRLAKRERRREFISVESGEIPDVGDSPSQGIRREERFSRLQSALDGLSPDHKEVIVLTRLKGLPLAVVAERLGRTPNAAAQLLGRALTKLKEAFGDTESLSLPSQPWNGPHEEGDSGER